MHQRKRLVADGVLERVLDGTYRFTGMPADQLARCVAACARPGRLVVQGPTAGRLMQVRRMPAHDTVYVIAPPASHPSVEPWMYVYRTALLYREDIIERPDGIRVTSPARTAVDLTRYLSPADLRSAIDDMIHRRLATAAQMTKVAFRLATPGRPWARRFLDEMAARPEGAAPESHWESRVVAELIRRGVSDLTPQRWLEVPAWGNIRLDASVDDVRWGIEIDGHPDHFTEDGATRDRDRDLACDAIGWRVSRVTTKSLSQNFDTAIDRLMRVHDFRRREFAKLTRSA